MKPSRFRWKPFVSITLALSFFLASLSGVMLYLSPRGRIANWTNWEMLGVSKDGWEAFHISAIVIMLVAGILHLFWLNWKLFFSYFKRDKTTKHFKFTGEIVTSVVLFGLIFAGTAFEWPGVFAFVDLREGIKEHYEKVSDQPPFPHAEELKWEAFALAVMELDDEAFLELVAAKELSTPLSDETVTEWAKRLGLSPKELMHVLTGTTEKTKSLSEKNAIHGSGYGKMTLGAFCKKMDLDLKEAQHALKEMKISDADASVPLRTLCSGTKWRPGELAKEILNRAE